MVLQREGRVVDGAAEGICYWVEGLRWDGFYDSGVLPLLDVTRRGINGINAVRGQEISVKASENHMGNEGFFYLCRQLWLFR